MFRNALRRFVTAGLVFACMASALAGAAVPKSVDDMHTLMRFPTLHGDTIVFEAHGNLWEVPRGGGRARRLTAENGYDMMPRFSPDGRWIAFTGEYQGNVDVYVIPAGGGRARRLTFHSDVVAKTPERWGPDNMVVTWTPDSANIIFLSRRMAWNAWIARPFQVPVGGGLPTPLPLDSGGLLTYGPDGKSIAYNRIFRNFRTWKRYDGGMAQDVFTYDFDTKKLERITHWQGTDTAPMWYGRKIFFLSDRDANRRENIWVYDLDSKQFDQVTHFTDYDIDFPSLGAGPEGKAGIVFQQGGSLWVLDLPSQKLHRLDVTVPDDGTRTSPYFVDAGEFIRDRDIANQTDYMLSPNGKRALLAARGDLFTLPVGDGTTRNLTRTSHADEDHASWSPDGGTIAYTTDVDGEQQIAIRPAAGGAEKIITRFKAGFLYQPKWSPDGKHLAVADGHQRLWLIDVDSGRATQVAQDPYQEIHDQSWSPDGRWLAYSITGANRQNGIRLYNLSTGKAARVSQPLANDFDPVFSPDGKYLYFISTRHVNPTFSESDFDVATLKMNGIYAATLQKDEASPFAPRTVEGAVKGSDKGNGKDKVWTSGASRPIKIDIDALMTRAVPLPIPANIIGSLDVHGDNVFYMTEPPNMMGGKFPGEKAALYVFDMAKRKNAKVIEGLKGYSLAANGEKILYKQGKHYRVADATGSKNGKPKNVKTLKLNHMRTRIMPTQEWAEMFDNAWRLQRDLFVNANMNGVDWQAEHDAYAKLLPLVGSREDLNYVLGELMGELGNSHTYVGGGDDRDPEKPLPTALLGVDFALDIKSSRYYFAKIYPGDNTLPDYRSPLTEPGIDVKQGDYLLAVDGRELEAPANPYSLFVGLDNQPVALTVADAADGKRRDITVTPIKDELSVRENAWIDANRKTVDRLSDGKIGYIYMTDMATLGMKQFVRQFYSQLDKQALIIDDRWNRGGLISQIVLERLRRVLVGISTTRERAVTPIPQQLITGPKVCLINHYSSSDGDLFPYYFRQYGLGPLIGTRTWGGVRGIRGYWKLLDGGHITVPESSVYSTRSEWVLENHGVEPDITVDDTPGEFLAGTDKQLETAVDYLLDRLKKHPGGLPPPPPPLPAYPPRGRVPPPSH
jgi:tricorn protease